MTLVMIRRPGPLVARVRCHATCVVVRRAHPELRVCVPGRSAQTEAQEARTRPSSPFGNAILCAAVLFAHKFLYVCFLACVFVLQSKCKSCSMYFQLACNC